MRRILTIHAVLISTETRKILVVLLFLYAETCFGTTTSFSFPDTVPDVIISSESPAQFQFGIRSKSGGDVNGDGYDDFVTTADKFDDCRGRAYLYFGGKNRVYEHADRVFEGEAAGDLFGVWITMGDLNNDKHADVIVGAVGYNNWQGRVYVYYGGRDMDERADMIFDGEPNTFSWFGRVLDTADIDRDGYTDLIINAVGINEAKSRVYLYYGGDPMDTVPDKFFEGENAGDVFGREMDMGPDVNGDGYGDIIFGSRSWGAAEGGGAGQGRTYLYYGGPKETMDTTCDKVFTGENMRDQFGCSVCLFDVDADGHAEVLVGARGYNSFQGRMYLYWGGEDIEAQPDLIFNGEMKSDFGGDTIACGYFNDDKYGDILIGGYSGGRNREGRVYLYYGAPKDSMNTTCDHTFTGEASMFGAWFSVGEINGDKCDDLVVSAGLRRSNRDDTVNRVYIYYTKPFPVTSGDIQPQFVTEIAEDVKPISSLHEAAKAGNIDQIKSLIKKGANINSLASDSGMITPLHEAAIAGHKDVVEILLDHGAQVDALDNMALTPLHCAAKSGHRDIAELLIERGANIAKRDIFSATALHNASQEGHREIVELLIAKGADVNAKNYRGKSPLGVVGYRNRKEIIALLKKHGAREEAPKTMMERFQSMSPEESRSSESK